MSSQFGDRSAHVRPAPLRFASGPRGVFAIVADHIFDIDVADSAHEADIVLDLFEGRSGRGIDIAVSRCIDHHVCENGLPPGLAFENGSAHGAPRIDNGVHAPAVEIRAHARGQNHIRQNIFKCFRIDGRIHGSFFAIDNSDT